MRTRQAEAEPGPARGAGPKTVGQHAAGTSLGPLYATCSGSGPRCWTDASIGTPPGSWRRTPSFSPFPAGAPVGHAPLPLAHPPPADEDGCRGRWHPFACRAFPSRRRRERTLSAYSEAERVGGRRAHVRAGYPVPVDGAGIRTVAAVGHVQLLRGKLVP